jgi:hypothetical protein
VISVGQTAGARADQFATADRPREHGYSRDNAFSRVSRLVTVGVRPLDLLRKKRDDGLATHFVRLGREPRGTR